MVRIESTCSPSRNLKLASNPLGLVERIFDLDRQRVHRALLRHCEPILLDFGKLAEDLFDRAGIDVNTANNHHIVHAAEDTAGQVYEAVFAAPRVTRDEPCRRCGSGSTVRRLGPNW